jgi:hypothetical protein
MQKLIFGAISGSFSDCATISLSFSRARFVRAPSLISFAQKRKNIKSGGGEGGGGRLLARVHLFISSGEKSSARASGEFLITRMAASQRQEKHKKLLPSPSIKIA